MPRIDVTTLYGRNTQEPIVEVTFPKNKNRVQLTVPEARDLAMNILQGAESALQDAFIIDFCKTLDIDDRAAAAMLQQFRLMRRDRQSDPSA